MMQNSSIKLAKVTFYQLSAIIISLNHIVSHFKSEIIYKFYLLIRIFHDSAMLASNEKSGTTGYCELLIASDLGDASVNIKDSM